MWPKAEDLHRKREEGGIQLQVRHMHMVVTMQVSLCELGLLPEYQWQPGQHRWRCLVGIHLSLKQTPMYGQLNSVLDCPQLAVCAICFNWLEKLFSYYSASTYRKGPTFALLLQMLLSRTRVWDSNNWKQFLQTWSDFMLTWAAL